MHNHHHIHLTAHDIKQRYDGAEGNGYTASEFVRETLLRVGPLRRNLLKKASGNILDVACGSGENFAYYRYHGTTYTGIELSPVMLAKARARARHLGMLVSLHEMDAENLTFANNSFDTVISALSTCTFPDPIAALQEMRRVCKPDGHILLMEHGRSSWDWLARWQDRNAPAQYAKAGCRMNQEPLKIIEEAGLTIIESKRSLLGIMHTLVLAPAK